MGVELFSILEKELSGIVVDAMNVPLLLPNGTIHRLGWDYSSSSGRNTGIPEILEIMAVTRNSGVLRSGIFSKPQAPLRFLHRAHY